MQSFLLELICLNDVELLNHYLKTLKPPLSRFHNYLRQKRRDKEKDKKDKEKDKKDDKKEETFTEEDEKLKQVLVGIVEQSQ